MIRLVQHRGPDEYGYYTDETIGLAHARLSIIDLSGGSQPIHDTDRNTWVIFNGEIFNYTELREDLIREGCIFYTQSDTEVLVHLYNKHGLDFVNYLNGQFAIALWDKRRKTLVLARDRVGITPLFFYKHGSRFYFASEVKSLLPCMPHSPTLNHDALDQIFTFWSPVASETMFKDVYDVKPGELIVIRQGDISHKRYWRWTYPEKDGPYLNNSVENLKEELHDKLVDATKIRLRSDVPVGAYLSGGLDSSSLVSIIHHYGNVPLRTFSIGFEDKQLDESKFQKNLIDHLGADHSNITCSAKDISDSFVRTIWHTESTILRTAPTPMMLLSGLVHRNNYKVVLTGEGADEVLGGYDIFKEGKIRRFWFKYPESNLRPILLKKLYPYLDISSANSRAYLEAFFGIGKDTPDVPYLSHMPRWDTTSKLKAFYSADMKEQIRSTALKCAQDSFNSDIAKWDPFNQSQYIEARMLMAKYLLCSQGDRMLMANSVEGRFPFLDHNVIEFANLLPPSLKMKVLNEKYLLKQAMARYLPEEITARSKQPYRAPDIPAFFHDHKPEYVEDLLSETEINKAGYFDSKKISILMKKINAGKAIGYKDNMAFVAVLSTQIWHHLFITKFKDMTLLSGDLNGNRI